MNKEERHLKVLELKSKIKIKEEEISLKRLELSSLNKQLLDTEWRKISWAEMEIWLKENGSKKYEENPVLMSSISPGIKSYCFLTPMNELQIGSYVDNDYFPRSKSFFIAYDFRKWRSK